MKIHPSKLHMATALSVASVLAISGCHSTKPTYQPKPDQPVVTYPGNDIDAQEKELSEFLTQQGIPYVREGINLVIRLPEAITFATGSATLKPQAISSLTQMATVFSKYNQSTIHVIGYTDSTGTDAINDKLSLQRAQNVSKILQDKGVGAFRLNAVGAGSKNPIASNDTAEGRAQNRRVELVLQPLQLKR
ncbi:OmpA family protein [Neisseria sp. Ec49-e6-T10]|uniref:OmpA family protein n=1 Tax=Neisseria sp. Ec49-e6-T10 TaxID=3140744 RepID=UPI003EBB9BC9